MFLGETQIPKVQKLGVQKRIVFLPAGDSRWWCWPIWKTNAAVKAFCNFTVRACCVLHRTSQVMWCVSWQALAKALQQNSSLTDLHLSYNNIGPEGAKAWCLVRMVSWGERVWRKAKKGSRHSCLTVRSGKWRKVTQCSIGAQMTQMCQIYHWSLWWQLIEDTENHQNWILAKEEIGSKKPL